MLSLRTRRLFFYFLVIIFIFAGTGLIFYSRGWRPSFNDNCGISQIQNCWPNFQKTGAIFLKLKNGKRDSDSRNGQGGVKPFPETENHFPHIKTIRYNSYIVIITVLLICVKLFDVKV